MRVQENQVGLKVNIYGSTPLSFGRDNWLSVAILSVETVSDVLSSLRLFNKPGVMEVVNIASRLPSVKAPEVPVMRIIYRYSYKITEY